MENLLEVKKLSKTYKNGRKALDNLNFHVTKGEILGFLGPNGAGKSTTINILSTLLRSDEGEIIFFNDENLSLKDVKKQLGIVPQELAIYEDITAVQNVKFFASLYGVKKSEINEKVENALNTLDGVYAVVDSDLKKAHVHMKSKVDETVLRKTVNDLGEYTVLSVD